MVCIYYAGIGFGWVNGFFADIDCYMKRLLKAWNFVLFTYRDSLVAKQSLTNKWVFKGSNRMCKTHGRTYTNIYIYIYLYIYICAIYTTWAGTNHIQVRIKLPVLFSDYLKICPSRNSVQPDLWVCTWKLQWRHDEDDAVSNHQPQHCLLNRLFKAQIKENTKAPRHCRPLWGEFTGDRWIPHAKGQ